MILTHRKKRTQLPAFPRFRKKRKAFKHYIVGLVVLLLILHLVIFWQYLKYKHQRPFNEQQPGYQIHQTNFASNPSQLVAYEGIKEEEQSIGDRYTKLIKDSTPSDKSTVATIAYGECPMIKGED
jgi:hypothetical protein